MKKTVYILGNPLLPTDSLPLKLMPKLQKLCPWISFQLFDPTEGEIPDKAIIIDTVAGIKQVQEFNDLNHFSKSARNSVHDYDLPVFLGLMLKLRKIKSFTIIGVPEKYPLKKAVSEVGDILLKVKGREK